MILIDQIQLIIYQINYIIKELYLKVKKNKYLLLYFENQFTPDIKEEDLNYLIHIFEIKHIFIWNTLFNYKFNEHK